LVLLLLIGALTWLLVKGMAIEAPGYAQAIGALDDYNAAQASLTRDVLSSRAGLLRNYDPLVADISAMRAAANQLNADPDIAAIAGLESLVTRQERLTEHFKSQNARLQNSLAYFDLLSNQLEELPQLAQTRGSIALLGSAMLDLTLEPSAVTRDTLEQRLDALKDQSGMFPDPDSVERLTVHGRILATTVPAVDAILTRMLALAQDPGPDNARFALNADHREVAERVERYWLLLYAASLLLVVTLAQFGLRLRAGTTALRRRAALESVIAQLSTRLIVCAPDDVAPNIAHGLEGLAACLGADRAYVVIERPDDPSPVLYSWSRPNLAFTSMWPWQAPELADLIDTDQSRMVHVPRVARLSCVPVRQALTAAGVRCWTCIKLPPGRAGTGVLGFDCIRSAAAWPADELAFLQLAVDAIAGVLGRLALESHRTALEQRIQRARKMEAVGMMASGIAHNFNNIVGAIAGHTEMATVAIAAWDSVKPPLAAEHLEEIGRAAGRARDLVSQILDFGQRRPLQQRPLDARGLFEETVSLICDTLPGKVRLIAEASAERPQVWGNFGQLQQILLNLCNNAVQAVSNDGTILMSLDLQETEHRQLMHGALVPGHYVRFTVSDTGHGMDDTTLRRVFEPFFTTRAAGTGLGLATVLETVHEHGGAIDVSSTVDVGTRFEVWLPCATGREIVRDREIDAIPLGNSETVLLLISETEQRLRGEEILAALRYEPVGFSNGHEAVAACIREPTRFDALVIDYHLAKESAMEVAIALHAIVPDQPLLLVTEATVELRSSDLIRASIAEVIGHPLANRELAEALARCLTRNAKFRRYVRG